MVVVLDLRQPFGPFRIRRSARMAPVETACGKRVAFHFEIANSIVLASIVALGALVVTFAAASTALRHTETFEAAEWFAGFAIGVPLGLIVAASSSTIRCGVAPLPRRRLSRCSSSSDLCTSTGSTPPVGPLPMSWSLIVVVLAAMA
jgi:hypothetical protein